MRKIACSAKVFIAVLTAVCIGGLARAQMSPDNVNVAIAKLFGNATAFTAAADVQVLDKSQKEWARTPMNFSVLDGKIRTDIDMNQMSGAAMPPNVLQMFKQMGMDHLASITRPDKKSIYIVYPSIRSYVNMPMSKSTAEDQSLKVEKTPLGRETIDGHACVKNHVVIKDGKGAVTVDATTWNAADLKDFPVQIQTQENQNTTIMHFRQIKLAKPEANLFEAPAGFTSYPNPQALMMARMKALQPAPAAR